MNFYVIEFGNQYKLIMKTIVNVDRVVEHLLSDYKIPINNQIKQINSCEVLKFQHSKNQGLGHLKIKSHKLCYYGPIGFLKL